MPAARILTGALRYSGSQHVLPAPVLFQFNPATITRRQIYSDVARRVTETIRFELVLNAMDSLEQEDPVGAEHGIYPQLAALEEILSYQQQLQSTSWLGRLFGYGPTRFLMWVYGERIVPVMLQRMTIQETMHNGTLKPIHAVVDITLRVLTEHDLGRNSDGLAVLDNYHQQRKLKSELVVAKPE